MSVFRLDYITKFKPGTLEKMTEIRAKFVQLENEISNIFEEVTEDDSFRNSSRVFEECLTHLEQSQMYAIKMLCLLGEERSETEG